MILEEATHDAYEYWPSDLKPHSSKHLIATCELCGVFKITTKGNYYTFCLSCAHKGYKHTEEAKANMSAALKGNTNSLGRTTTEETKALIRS